MNDNIFKVLANNWKSIPLVARILLISIVVSAVVLSVTFIPSSSTSTKVQLIQDAISDDVKANILALLQKEQIPFSVRHGKIFVAAQDKDRALFKLYTENIIPEGPDLYKWVFEMDISETREKRNLKWQTTMKRRLEQMMSKMDNIEWAKLEFTQHQTGPFFEELSQEPKASILLKLKHDTPLTKNQSLAIAKFTSFALGNIDPKNVTIIDTKQRLYTIPDSKEMLTSEQLQYKLTFEEAMEKKVYDFLSSFLTFVRVKASVSIDWKSSYVKKSGIDPERQIIVKEQKELTRGSNTQSAGVPGIISKLPAMEDTENLPSSNYTISQKEFYEREAAQQESVENLPAGTIKDLTLAVVVQKSEIINVFADPAKMKKHEDAFLFAQKQLVDTLSKGVNIPLEKIVVTAVNLTPAKELSAPSEPTPVQTKITPINTNIIIITLAILAAIIIAIGLFNRKKVLLEQKLQQIAHDIQRKEMEMAPTTVEEEPIIKEIKSIVKTNPQIASLIIKQWLKEK